MATGNWTRGRSSGSVLTTSAHGLLEDPVVVERLLGRRPSQVLEPTFELLADVVDEFLDTALLLRLTDPGAREPGARRRRRLPPRPAARRTAAGRPPRGLVWACDVGGGRTDVGRRPSQRRPVHRRGSAAGGRRRADSPPLPRGRTIHRPGRHAVDRRSDAQPHHHRRVQRSSSTAGDSAPARHRRLQTSAEPWRWPPAVRRWSPRRPPSPARRGAADDQRHHRS